MDHRDRPRRGRRAPRRARTAGGGPAAAGRRPRELNLFGLERRRYSSPGEDPPLGDISYQDFDLLIERADGGYRARAQVGDRQSRRDFALPDELPEMARLVERF